MILNYFQGQRDVYQQIIDAAAKYTHDIEKPVTLGQIAVLMTQFYKNLKLIMIY